MNKIVYSMLIFIFVLNSGHAQVCRNPLFESEVREGRVLCQDVLKSTICRSVEKKDLKNCKDENVAKVTWDTIAGCAEGTLDSLSDIIDFFKSVMTWVWDAMLGEKDLGKMGDQAEAMGDSASLYLKNEYQRHYQKESEPFRDTKAMAEMGQSIAQVISDKVEDYFDEKSLVYKHCLNAKAQSRVTCEFISSFFLPPAGAIAFLKYGPKAFSRYKNLADGAEKAEKLIPTIPKEFKLKPRELLTRKELDETYVHFSPTTSAQNEKWIKLARSEKPATFLEVENSALKRLNDQLGDKNLVTALTNMHKDLLFEGMDKFIKKYPDLELLKYSDFKSSRFAFNKELSPKQLEELNAMIREVNTTFATEVKKMKLGTRLEKENVAGWFSSGIGKSADQAGLASRESRMHARTEGLYPTPIVSFESIRSNMAKHAKLMDSNRIALVSKLEKNPNGSKILETIPGTNQKVLTREAIEAMRKGEKDAFKIFDEKFGIKLDPQEKLLISEYYRGIDKLAPGIWIEERVVANLDDATVGGFSADFAGMGAANIHQVAVDLVATRGKNVDALINQIRRGEGIVTKEFESKKTGFQTQVAETMQKLGQEADLKCSGDDCVSLVRKSLNVARKKEVVSDLMRKMGPSSMRLSFIPPGVPKALRTKIAVAGEGIEKELRKKLAKLDADGIHPDKMKDVMLALDMPKGVKVDQVNLIIGLKNKDTLSPAEIELVQKKFKEVMKEFDGKINYDDGIIPHYQSGNLIIVRN